MRISTKYLTIAALLLVLTLATLESTVVATAMPSIVGQLGDMALYSWIFSAYLLTSTVTVPLYGKLADLYGRRVILFIGVGVFLLGSMACGSAQSMEQLAIFRAIQGLGAGAIQPLVLTILADLSTSSEDLANKQGWVGALWGMASIAGPILGGLLVDSVSWRWVFYLNIPLGVLALGLLILCYKEKRVRQKHQLDYLGTLLLTGAILALLLALLQGGNAWGWTSLPSISLFLIALVCILAFWRGEAHAAEPIIALDLFKSRSIVIASLGGFLLGCMLYGITTYVPLFAQTVQGETATEAGIPLISNSLSWSLLSMIAGVILRRLGLRLTVQIGAFFILLGTGMMLLFQQQTSLTFLLITMAILGVGFGFVNIVYTVAVQRGAPQHAVGVATALTQFARLLGGTVGVATMGTIFNEQISQRFAFFVNHAPLLANKFPRGTSPESFLLRTSQHSSFDSTLLAPLREIFAQSLTWVFLLMLVMAILGFVLMLWFPDIPIEQQEIASIPAEIASWDEKEMKHRI